MTGHHLTTLSRFTANVTLAFDADPAGLHAIERTAGLDRAHHRIRLHVATLPDGVDPADLLTTGRTHALQEAIATAAPLEHHLIDRIVEQHNLDEPEAVARTFRAARSVLYSATDNNVRTKATQHLAAQLGRDVALIAAHLEETSPHRTLERQPDTGRSLP